MEKISRVLRVVGLGWGAVGVFAALSILLGGGAPHVMPDADVISEAVTVLLSNVIPGAFVIFLASKFRRQGGQRVLDLTRLGAAVGRMAEAKAYAENQSKPSGVTSHGTRAGVIHAADNPTVTGRAARKSVIER